MNLLNLIEQTESLNERGAPTQALLKQAQNSGMTFGCEAEFYISGVHEVFKKFISADTKRDDHNRLIKSLADLSYYDVQLFCHPLRVTPGETKLGNDAIIKKRITSTYKRMIDPTPMAPPQMWQDLVDRFGPSGAMMLCGVFPTNGFKVHSTENDYLRQEFNLFLAQPTRAALSSAQDNDHLSVILTSPHEDDKHLYQLDTGSFAREAIMEQIAVLISRVLQEPVVVGLNPDENHTTSAGYTKWLLTTDPSLKQDDHFDTIGVELISPKSPLQVGFQHVRSLFNLINDFGSTTGVKKLRGFTTEQTGFHMNLGIPNKPIDYVKLLTLIGDDYLIKKFGRSQNANTMPTFRDMARRFRGNDAAMPDFIARFEKLVPVDEEDIKFIINALSTSVIKHKFQSVNLTKLAQHGYVEFRALGNKDYQMRISDVEQALTTFATMMYAATDPQVYRKEYLTKIYKIIKGAADRFDGPTGSNGPNKEGIDLIKNQIGKNQIVSILERKDREVARRWFTVNEYLQQYMKTGRVNSYAFRQAANNFLTSIRIGYAEGRFSISSSEQKLIHQLIGSLRTIGELFKSSKM